MSRNDQFAQNARRLADIYEREENADVMRPALNIFADTKAEVLKVIRAVGGRWTKHVPGGDLDYHIRLESAAIPGLTVFIPRDKVCRKTVKYDCEPLLSPEDEAEVETAIKGE